MGFWSIDINGRSFVKQPGLPLVWGDAPAAALASALEGIYARWGRVPDRDEVLNLWEEVQAGDTSGIDTSALAVGLKAASVAFRAALARNPSQTELRAGLLYASSQFPLLSETPSPTLL
jgi:hypothetical protein